MRVVDRIFDYMYHHHLSAYQFERELNIANGYLKKQLKGKGSVGSEILEKIARRYKDLNITWLVTGAGKMILGDEYTTASETPKVFESTPDYHLRDETVILLKEKIAILENALADKEKIIGLLEQKLARTR